MQVTINEEDSDSDCEDDDDDDCEDGDDGDDDSDNDDDDNDDDSDDFTDIKIFTSRGCSSCNCSTACMMILSLPQSAFHLLQVYANADAVNAISW